MKRIIALLIAVLTVFTLCAFVASADEISGGESSAEVFVEHPNKQYTWAYWLVGIVALLGVVASAIIVSKKVK